MTASNEKNILKAVNTAPCVSLKLLDTHSHHTDRLSAFPLHEMEEIIIHLRAFNSHSSKTLEKYMYRLEPLSCDSGGGQQLEKTLCGPQSEKCLLSGPS